MIIRRSDWKGPEVTPKSKRGSRVASVDPLLVEILKAHIGKRTSVRPFCTRNRTPLGRRNVNRNRLSNNWESRGPEHMRFATVAFLRQPQMEHRKNWKRSGWDIVRIGSTGDMPTSTMTTGKKWLQNPHCLLRMVPMVQNLGAF